ncbi:glycosyltransferase family 31 protein [Piedraia hortae CBS 480.64]|uniref:N-acetylgalactosaminide beta-1,3-galactosyltransferase n=1 Tax=Piedraia hortae CBS 480.64 TaxID=1314780 RepID=A0A6A7BV89_9PEZI|nr:glycosyltransferase family 31 protein [Piedraia hortae CBS 480.64]
MATSNFRTRHFLRLLLGAGAIIGVIHLFNRGHLSPDSLHSSLGIGRTSPFTPPEDIDQTPLPCSELEGANDTVVIMKTGATEMQARLPVHLSSTFRCYPNRLVISDHVEDYYGHKTIDALEYVTSDVKASNPDFILWRRLRKNGRKGLTQQDLSMAKTKVTDALGKPDNPGWKLDKWKFLPMVNRTLFEYPSKQWYIFVETDTYIMWSTTLAWLNTLNASEPIYLGAQMQIGDVIFAHGGSGFILSQAAMRNVVELFRHEQRKWEGFTQEHWAGDCVLGRAVHASGCPLTWAWPIFQGNKPGAVQYGEDNYSKRLWCYPTISYHHMLPEEIKDLWTWEQERIARNEPLVRHHNVFNDYILPRIASGSEQKPFMSDWNNLSPDLIPHVKNVIECREKCENEPNCVQFVFYENQCKHSTAPLLGEGARGARSGWLLDRVERFRDSRDQCKDELWIDLPKIRRED